MGGIGKTEIALHFTATRQGSFDATFFIPAENTVKIDDAFSEIAIELELLSADEAKDRLASKSAVLGWLSKPVKFPPATGERESVAAEDMASWLLVFDNIDSKETLREYTPLQGPGAVLVTSRDPSAKHYLSPNSGVDLQPLHETAAADLLQGLTYQTTSQSGSDEALRLVRRLDCLPIAILHAAGVIDNKDTTFEEYLTRYEKHVDLPQDTRLAMSQGMYAQILTAVWALKDLPPPASALLKVLDLLDNDPIQESLLRNDVAHEFMAAYPLMNEYDDVRPVLSRTSLIRRNKITKALSVNNVVQDVQRQMMDKYEIDVTFRTAVALVDADWQHDRTWVFGHRATDWQVADAAVPHVLKLAKHYRFHKLSLEPSSLRRFVSLVTRASM
jgi:hypothetical protein